MLDSNYEPTDVPAYVAYLRDRARKKYSEWWIEEYKKAYEERYKELEDAQPTT